MANWNKCYISIITAQGILKRICLAVLKFVQTYYNLSLNKIRFLLSIDFEKEIENVFKLLNTDDIVKLLEKNT